MINPSDREVAVFNAARRLTADAQAVFLTEACAGDAALRQRIEELLRANEEAGAFLQEPARGAQRPAEASAPSHPEETAAPAEKVGNRIGRYKLLQQIGEGGCGVVYMAEQEEPVRRRVALKIIKLGMDTKSVIARFEAERQALALMDHANIAKVLDAGATETGRPYFVMELVRGVKITDYCDENKISTEDRLKLFIQVCQAIQHAHQKGVIHRDIKPSNILVTVNDGLPVPKVIDFGIAKATGGQPLTDKTLFTAFEQFIGTPAYMSPEQAVMTSLDIDTRSDIYSLGVLLYELLTSKTPFDGKALMAQGLDAMRRSILEQEPVRPSTRLCTMLGNELTATATHRQTGPPELIHLVRGDLDWIVMKALEKDRARRYETANSLAMDIQRHLADEPVVARPPSRVYLFQKLVRRNRLAFGAVACVVTVLVVGVIISTWQAIRAARAEREGAQQRNRAQTQELESRQRAYASDLNLAQQALAQDNLGRGREIIFRQRPNPGQKDMRGWEWRYLWQQCQSDAEFVLCQKATSISSLAASSDGRWIAVGEWDNGGLSVWDLRKQQEIARLPGGKGYVQAAFSPAEALLAFSLDEGDTLTNRQHVVRFWDVSTKRLTRNELPLLGQCRALAFSDDGQTLITSTASPEDEIALWRVRDGKKLQGYSALQARGSETSALAVSPDFGMAAHANRDKDGSGIRVVDLATGKERWSVRPAENNVTALAFSPDGKILASGGGYLPSPIHLWDAASGREINRLGGHRGWIGALVFWPNGKTIASASSDQTIRLWDLTCLTNIPSPRILRGHRLEVWRLTLLPDARTLVSGSKDGSVCVWDTQKSRPERGRVTLPGEIFTWRFAPDSKSVLNLDCKGRVSRWSGDHFQHQESLADIGTTSVYWEPRGALIAPDCQSLAIGFTNGTLQVWDLSQHAQMRRFIGLESPLACEFRNQGRELVTVNARDGSHHRWDLVTGREIGGWPGSGAVATSTSIAFSPDGRWCLAVSGAGSTLLTDLENGQKTNLGLRISRVLGSAFSPDGKLFAVSSQAGFARLWETTTFQEKATLSGFLQGVGSVAWSPDSNRLATGSDGKEAIKIWDTNSHEELLTLEGDDVLFWLSAFSPDGNILGSMSAYGVLHLWRAPTWEDIGTAAAEERKDDSAH